MSTIELKITSPLSEYPYLKRFQSAMKLSDFKEKLELVVGALKEHMKLELHDRSGKLVSFLTEEQATLASLNVVDGMEIHVIDMASNNVLEDTSTVEKYVLPDEKYNERAESVRAWRKREQLISKPNAAEESEKVAQNVKVGDFCVVQLPNQPPKTGTVSFVGTTKFRPGWWVGITYNEPVGKNDGSVNGIRYFTCAENYGGFVRPQDVQIVQQSQHITDVEMEEI